MSEKPKPIREYTNEPSHELGWYEPPQPHMMSAYKRCVERFNCLFRKLAKGESQ